MRDFTNCLKISGMLQTDILPVTLYRLHINVRLHHESNIFPGTADSKSFAARHAALLLEFTRYTDAQIVYIYAYARTY